MKFHAPFNEHVRNVFLRFGFQILLVVGAFAAAWIIFSARAPSHEFYVQGNIDQNHIFRVYDFSSTHAGTIRASIQWDTEDKLQLRIADEKGKIQAESVGASPVEISSSARANETYKVYVLGTKKNQQTNFTLSAANSPLEIIDDTSPSDAE
ncbi:hypothetical protein KBC77_02715 [Candidatus Saccharibacteria bacterium]|nr:hypothetical protein [Candidatus Saccharibacteria bacterium]